MKKLLIGALVLCTSSAFASPYFVGRLGLDRVQAEDSGVDEKYRPANTILELGAGYRLTPNFHVTATIGASTGDEEDKTVSLPGVVQVTRAVKVETTSFMLDAFYDFNFGSKFVPFIGAGIGYTTTEIECDTDIIVGPTEREGIVKFDDGNFTYRATAGVSYAYSDKITWDFSYSYADLGKVTDPVGDDYKIKSNQFKFAFRYAF